MNELIPTCRIKVFPTALHWDCWYQHVDCMVQFVCTETTSKLPTRYKHTKTSGKTTHLHNFSSMTDSSAHYRFFYFFKKKNNPVCSIKLLQFLFLVFQICCGDRPDLPESSAGTSVYIQTIRIHVIRYSQNIFCAKICIFRKKKDKIFRLIALKIKCKSMKWKDVVHPTQKTILGF